MGYAFRILNPEGIEMKDSTRKIVYMGMLAALTYVATLIRFPLLGSKVHLANSLCLLCGLLMGPVSGGLAAGLGSFLFDVTAGGYDFIQGLITFFSKFAMAYVAGRIAWSGGRGAENRTWNAAACVAGAWTYVALYLLKTYVYQRFVYGYPVDAVWATVAAKAPASCINAVAAMVIAPILYEALKRTRPAGLANP